MKFKLLIKECGMFGAAMFLLTTEAKAATFNYTNSSNATFSFTDSSCANFSTNAAGASLSISCNSSPQTPQCTLTASPSSLATAGTIRLTATCNPVATSYAWGNGIASIASTVDVNVAATTSYTVIGSNATGAGSVASATVTVSGSGSGRVIPASCPNNGYPLSVVGADFDWNIGGGIATYGRGMKAGEAYIYKFTTGEAQTNLVSLSLAEYGGTYVPERTVTISEAPCDFDPASKANAYGVGTNPTAYFSVGAPNNFGYVTLKANSVYYVNIKNAYWQVPDHDTCPVGKDCSFVISLRR